MDAHHPSRMRKRKSDPWAIPVGAALECADVLLRGIAALARIVPEERALQFAPILGKMARGPWKRRTLGNMRLFLGNEDWSEAQWEQLWNAHTLHLGQTIVEVFAWQSMTADELQRRVSVRGEEHLLDALRPGRGAMVLANHLGNFVSVAPCVYRLGVGGCSSGNAMPTRYLERMLQEFLSRFGIRRQYLGQGVPSAAAETFRRGAIFFAFADLSLAGKRDEWFRFGRAETNVSIGPALIALRYRVPLLCVSCVRLDTTHHEVTFHPPLRPSVSDNAQSDARQLTARALEVVADAIRQHPEQWWQWDWSPLRRAKD